MNDFSNKIDLMLEKSFHEKFSQNSNPKEISKKRCIII